MTVSVVTPWLNASELCAMYARGLVGAQLIAVDNGSEPDHAERIRVMAEGAGGIYLRNEFNFLFAAANNQGLAQATGEIVLFLNNDVECRRGFLEQVERDVQPGALYGPSKLTKHKQPYLEGWCIAGTRETWDALGGWDDLNYRGLYWEDNDLCFRAAQQGIKLIQTRWPVWHQNNYTSNRTPGAKDHAFENERVFLEKVRDAHAQPA